MNEVRFKVGDKLKASDYDKEMYGLESKSNSNTHKL
jgi:hypothetical protein